MKIKNPAGEDAGETSAGTALQFRYGRGTFRVTGTPEQPMFCAADVCAALGHTNAAAALQAIPEDEKGIRTFYTPGGRQKMVCLTEPGLYRLIFRSNKPKAERFRKWVFAEVLPSIRRSGGYHAPAGGNDTDLERAAWLLAQVLKFEPAARVLRRLLPLGRYGAPSANGHRKTGFRRACWVAQPHRTKDAEEIADTLPLISFALKAAGELNGKGGKEP